MSRAALVRAGGGDAARTVVARWRAARACVRDSRDVGPRNAGSRGAGLRGGETCGGETCGVLPEVRATLVLAIACLGVLAGGCAREAPARPNVIVWLVDTLRADHLHAYGAARQTSPTLDGLAGGGVLFEQVHAHANWTQPSVASILSGRYPLPSGGEFASRVPEGLTLAAEWYRDHGYATAGLTTTVATAAQFGFAQGCDDYEELDLMLDVRARTQRSAAVYGADALVGAALRWIDGRGRRAGGGGTAGGDGADGSEGSDERDGNNGNVGGSVDGAAPFFLSLHSVDPHAPYTGRADEPRFAGAYGGPIDGSVASLVKADKGGYAWTDADRQHVVDLYDEDVRFNDRQLGVLCAELERRGLLQDTLLVIVADHGEEFWEHGRLGHGHESLHAELTHIPLVMSWPAGLPAGRRVAGLARAIDILPTLAELCGLPPVPGVDGRSLVGVVRGENGEDGVSGSARGETEGDVPAAIARGEAAGDDGTPAVAGGETADDDGTPAIARGETAGEGAPAPAPAPRVAAAAPDPAEVLRDAVFIDRVKEGAPMQAVRTARWLLQAGDGRSAELFDLRADRGEWRDVSAEQPAVAAALGAALAEWRRARDAAAAPLLSGRELEVDEDTRSRLEALGYVGPEGR